MAEWGPLLPSDLSIKSFERVPQSIKTYSSRSSGNRSVPPPVPPKVGTFTKAASKLSFTKSSTKGICGPPPSKADSSKVKALVSPRTSTSAAPPIRSQGFHHSATSSTRSGPFASEAIHPNLAALDQVTSTCILTPLLPWQNDVQGTIALIDVGYMLLIVLRQIGLMLLLTLHWLQMLLYFFRHLGANTTEESE